MNVAAHEDKEKNDQTKTVKRMAVEERKTATNFEEVGCCHSAVVQEAARRKKDLCEGSDRSNWNPREGQQPFRPNPSRFKDRTTTLKRLLIGAIDINFGE